MSFLHAKSSNTTVNVSGGGGSGGGAVTNTFTSVGPVSAHKVLAATGAGIVYADKDTLTDQDKISGLSVSSVGAAGEEVTYVSSGLVTDSSFAFSVGPVYLSNIGAMTQTKPTSGLLVQIGIAIEPTTLQFDIQLNVRLA